MYEVSVGRAGEVVIIFVTWMFNMILSLYTNVMGVVEHQKLQREKMKKHIYFYIKAKLYSFFLPLFSVYLCSMDEGYDSIVIYFSLFSFFPLYCFFFCG